MPETDPVVVARSLGIGQLRRHLLICAGPKCAEEAAGNATWNYVKARLKELKLVGAEGNTCRSRCTCLQICTAGPIAVVYPEGTWYRNVTPENAERIIQQHIIGGRIVEELCFARDELKS